MEEKEIEKMLFAEYMAEHQKVEADALKFVFDARLKLLNEMHEKEVSAIEQSFEHIIKVANDQIQLHEQQMKHDMDMAKLHHPPRPRPRPQPQPQTPVPASSRTRPPRPTVASSRSKPNSSTANGSAGTKAPEPDTTSSTRNTRHSRRRQAKEQAKKNAVSAKGRKSDVEEGVVAENESGPEADDKVEAQAQADDDADDDVETVEVVRPRPTRATRAKRKAAKPKISMVVLDSSSELSPTPVLRRRRARTKR